VPKVKGNFLYWSKELRTPELLISVCNDFHELAVVEQARRSVLGLALEGRVDAVEEAFLEELEERRRDREYWAPLKRKLETMRRQLALARSNNES